MNILLTGATGFVGRALLKSLLAAGHHVRCLVRDPHKLQLDADGTGRVEAVVGDILQPETLLPALAGCDAVIHLIGIIREQTSRGVTFERIHVEGTQHLLDAVQQAGVKRFVHMSALGTRPDATSPYHKSKWQAEERVRASGLDWTIFRPSVIYGPGDEFVNMLAGVLSRAPLFPIFGHGQYRLQPVAREDVAAGFVGALENPASIGQVYDVGGPEAIAYHDLIQMIGRATDKRRVLTVSVPIGLVRPVVRAMEGFSFFPLTSSMLSMLLGGNTCDPTRYADDFHLTLTPFAEGIARYL